MKSDIEIAQEAAMIPVKEVAARYGIKEDDLELYGKYKAKLTDEPVSYTHLNANIIGKMTSKAGGEILETLDGWYKVKSGPIVGYISSDPQYTATGREAKDIALQTASLKAVISTDVLNVRTEPSTDAKIWTQIVKDEKYPVIDDPETPDGWLKIDLDSVDEEDGGVSDGAYISTRDNNVEMCIRDSFKPQRDHFHDDKKGK